MVIFATEQTLVEINSPDLMGWTAPAPGISVP